MKSVEYWVSEWNEDGDITDYTAQEMGPGAKQRAMEIFNGPFRFDDSTHKEIERVERWGDNDSGLTDQNYELIGTRYR